jgi:hypothetical protein
LIRLLYNRGYERQEVLELFRFIDWMLQLPRELELELTNNIILLEEQKMPYVTSIERFALERGEAIGEARGEANALLKLFKLKFGITPEWLIQKVTLANKDQLDQWLEKILTADTIENVINE